MTLGQRIVLILLGLSLLGGVVTGAQIYYRLAYLWVLFYLGNWAWSFFSLRRLTVRRTARTLRATLGQVFEERFDLTNETRLPRLWVEVRDESTLPGSLASQVFTHLGNQESRTYIARTRLVRRGVFPLGPTVLASGDLFGLFPSRLTIPAQNNLLVYPMLVDVRGFPNPLGMISGGDALRRRTPQITPNASGVREYAPGDSLNRIHWPTTARREMLMVKEFELDPLAEVWIFLDADRNVSSSLPWTDHDVPKSVWEERVKIELPPSTEEYSCSSAASLARYFIRNKRAVGLVSRSHNPTWLPSDRGGRQLIKILEALALWHADGNLPLLGLLESQSQHLPRGSTVILITPSTAEEVMLGADYLIRRGLRPVVVLLDSESFGGPPGTRSLAERIKFMSVPVKTICCNESLEFALSSQPGN
jgi:uncharacterized protein (DUF58 family)